MRNSDDAEGRGEEEEEEEEFYDSLDRILSSSCSSTSASSSASEDDADPQGHHRRRRCRRRPCGHWLCERSQRPGASSMYDVWISEPSSVAERRRRLLWQMGLIEVSSPPTKHEGGRDLGGDGDEKEDDGRREVASEQAVLQTEMERVACCDGINQGPDLQRNSPLPSISRSGHDEVMDPNPSSCFTSSSRPPLHKQHPSPEEHPAVDSPSSGADADPNHEDSDDGRRHCSEKVYNHCARCELYFTIKNLNNGEKFVVKELREDGMWKKLREVGTGRHLTMEEFQSSVIGLSPIVQELMRRQSVEEEGGGGGSSGGGKRDIIGDRWMRKKKGSWLRGLKSVAGTVVQHLERRSSDERDTSSEKGGSRSSSATDTSHGRERIKVRRCAKAMKDLTALYMNQEIQAHKGSIWSIKFSLDGRYLATAGEDRIIRVWQVMEKNRKGWFLSARDECREILPADYFDLCEEKLHDLKRRSKASVVRKSLSFEQIVAPECVFSLTEKPICSLHGHLDDVLDLSWSKSSEYLLSSSMDKTVRLWHVSTHSCLKIFTHSDYVTCIQFNPVDDNYFISGSLDAKVRIWSIEGRQVIHWDDLREMITAVCYRPDGQVALVGSHRGSCHLYDTSENKLHRRGQINLQNKKKRSHHKKITGFQFAPGSCSEVLITSADSRMRVVNGVDFVHKFRGMRNTSSQIAASFTADGEYVVCASEDSQVCVWRYDVAARGSRRRVNGVATTRAYENFQCRDVTAAVPWCGPSSRTVPGGRRLDRVATWPEEKLLAAAGGRPEAQLGRGSAWGMVIVTAGRGGEIRAFQNFGRPSR